LRESIIQSKVIKHFELKGYLVVKIIQCNKNGMPDLMLLKDGKTFFIECKTEKGRLSELQKYRHEQLQEHGFEVRTIYKIQDIC
jgi:Holliday junction resolvase